MRIYGLALLAVACGGGSGGSGEGTGTGTGGGVSRFEEFIFVDKEGVEASGDLSGFTPGDSWETTDWLTQTITEPTDLMNVTAVVEDFEKEYPVAKATVALWYDDIVDSTNDLEADSDVNGDVVVTAPACTPMAYRVTTGPDTDPTKTTYKAHHTYTYDDSGDVDDGLFLSVSETTYLLIPTILGVVVDPSKAIIAGTAYDVARDPALDSDIDTGKIEGAQVIVYDENGNIPDSLTVNYFRENFPVREQKWTSEDGLWVAANVPPGNLRVEMWGLVGGVRTLLGATELFSEPNSINISNIFAGYGDGVKYPYACEG